MKTFVRTVVNEETVKAKSIKHLLMGIHQAPEIIDHGKPVWREIPSAECQCGYLQTEDTVDL